MTAAQPSSSPATLYDTDYLQWITTTVDKLRRQDYNHVDWANLIEEIEDMGKRERRSREYSRRSSCGSALRTSYG